MTTMDRTDPFAGFTDDELVRAKTLRDHVKRGGSYDQIDDAGLLLLKRVRDAGAGATGNTPTGPDTAALAAGLESSRAYGGQGVRDLAAMFPNGQAPAAVNPEPWRAADPTLGFNRPGGTGLSPEERMVGVQPNFQGMAPAVRSSVEAYYHNTGNTDRPADQIPADWARQGQQIAPTAPSGLSPEQLAVQQQRVIRDMEVQRYAEAMGGQGGGVVESAIRAPVHAVNSTLRGLLGMVDLQGNPALTEAVGRATEARPEGLAARVVSGATGMVPVLTVGAMGGTPMMLGAMGLQSFDDAFHAYQADLQRKGDLNATGKALAAAAAVAPLETALNAIPAHRFLGALERASPGFGAFLRARAIDAATNAGIGAAADVTRQAGGVASGAQDQLDLRQTLAAIPEQAAVGGLVGAGAEAGHIGARGDRMGQVRDLRQAQADARATGGVPEQAGAYQPRPANPWEQTKAAPRAPIGRGDTTTQVPDGAGPPVPESVPQNGTARDSAKAPVVEGPISAEKPPNPADFRTEMAPRVEEVAADPYPRARAILDELGVPDAGEVAVRLGLTLPEADRLVGRWEAESTAPESPAPASQTGSDIPASRTPAESSRLSGAPASDLGRQARPESTRPALGSSRLGIPLDVVSEATRQREAAAENIARQSRPFAPPGRAVETERRSVLNRFRNPDTAGYSMEGSLTPEGVFNGLADRAPVAPARDDRASFPSRSSAPESSRVSDTTASRQAEDQPSRPAPNGQQSASRESAVASSGEGTREAEAAVKPQTAMEAQLAEAAKKPWQRTEAEYLTSKIRQTIRQYQRGIQSKREELARTPKGAAKRIADIETTLRIWEHRLEGFEKARDNHKASDWGDYRDEYVATIKKAISTGEKVPQEIIDSNPLFQKAQDARERYDKGRRTSFANRTEAIDDSMQEVRGFKVKRQDGKPITPEQSDHIAKGVAEVESAIGPLRGLMRHTDLTFSHTSGLYPFMSKDVGGLYHIADKTISIGVGRGPFMQRSMAHEMGHWLDFEAGSAKGLKARIFNKSGKVREASSMAEASRDRATADPEVAAERALIAEATRTMHDPYEAAKLARKDVSKIEDQAEKDETKFLQFKLSPYWREPREVWARLVEQYVASKMKGRGESHEGTGFYEKYPAWWSKENFEKLRPALEKAIAAKIEAISAVQSPKSREEPSPTAFAKLAEYAAKRAAELKAAPDIRQAGKGFKGKGGRAGASDLGRVASYAAWKAVELGAKAGERIRVTVEQAIEHLKRFGVDTTEANAKRVAKMANAWIGSAEKPDGTIDPGRLESAREAGMRRTRIAAAIGETKIRLSEQGKAARVAFNKGLAEGRRTAIDKLSIAADAEGTSRKAVLDIVKALPVGSRGRIEYVSLIARAKTLNDVREAARMVAFDLHREVVKQQLAKTERLAKYKNLTPELKADLATVNKDVAASLKGMAPQWTIREALAGKKKGDMIAARVPMKLSDAETTAGQVQLAVGAIAQKIATHRLDLKIAAEDQARTADYLAQNVAGRVSAQTPDTWTPVWGRDRTARAKFLGAWSRLGYTVQQLGKLLDNTQGKPEQGYAETLLFRRPLEGEGRVAGEMQRTMDTLDGLARKHGYKSFLEAEDEAANNYIDDTPLGRITWEEALTVAGMDPETKALLEQGAKVVPHGDVNKAPDQLDQERQKRITDKLPERAVKLYQDAKRAIYEEQYRDRALREIEVLTGTRPPTVEDYQPRRSLQQHNFESGLVNGSPDGIITVEHMLDAQRLERASFGKERIAGPNATFVVEPAYVVMKRQAARAAKIIHLARAVRDARSVFARQEVQQAIQKTFGRGAWRAVQRQIKQMSMLNPMSHDAGAGRVAKTFTRNVGRALTQLNPTSFLRQYGTLFNVMHDYGWARTVGAMKNFVGAKLRGEMIDSHALNRQRYETGQGFQTAQAVGGAGRPTKAGALDREGVRVSMRGMLRDLRRGDLAGAFKNLSAGFDAIKLNNIADAQVATVVYGMEKENARKAHPDAPEEKIREMAGEATALWLHRRANTSSSNSSALWVNSMRDIPIASPFALFSSDRTKIWNMLVDAKHEGKARMASATAAAGLNSLWSQSVGRVYRNVALGALASAIWGSQAEEEKKNLWGRNFIAAVGQDMLSSLPGGDAIGKGIDAGLDGSKRTLDSLMSNPVSETADGAYKAIVGIISNFARSGVELERDKAGGVTAESLLKAEKSAQAKSHAFTSVFDAAASLAGLPFAVPRRDLAKLLPENSIGGAFDKAAAQYGRGEMDYATETVARTYKAMLDGGVRPKAARDALVSRLSYRLGKDAKDKPAQKRAEFEAKKLVSAGITKANE